MGIDIPIQRHQQWLYPQLKTLWSLTDAEYDCHGRAYRNQTADGYVPEVFTGDNSVPGKDDYQEVLFDDSLKALSFYGVDETTKYVTGNAYGGVYLVFMVNVRDIKPEIIWRADEEIRNDVEKLCQIDWYDMQLTGIVTGIDQVFKEYGGWRKTDGIKYRDMHPTHCFRLNFQLLFDINECF